jgi:hypothetical protein
LLELLGVKPGKNPPKRVVRRNAVGQFKERYPPRQLDVRKQLHLDPVVRTTDDECCTAIEAELRRRLPRTRVTIDVEPKETGGV